jgi:hypothetical protein
VLIAGIAWTGSASAQTQPASGGSTAGILPAHLAHLSGTWESKASRVTRGTCLEEKSEIWLMTLAPHRDGDRLAGILTVGNTIRTTFAGMSSQGAKRCFAREAETQAKYALAVEPYPTRPGCEDGCLDAAMVACNGCSNEYEDKITGPVELRTTKVLVFQGRIFSRRE